VVTLSFGERCDPMRDVSHPCRG